MNFMQIPKRLNAGSKVASVCLSSGLASKFPELYAWGKKQVEEKFGIEIVAMTNTFRSPEELYQNPMLRVADFYEAWERSDIDGIISVIGGDDSIRLIRHLDPNRIKKNCKVFIGSSDTTVTHLFLHSCGIRSFYGPALLYGFADFGGLYSYTGDGFTNATMSAEIIGELKPYSGDSIAGYSSWINPATETRPATRPNPPWQWINGTGVWQGRLFGGCIEVISPLSMATQIWPANREFWNDKILFFEYSRELANPEFTLWFIRNLAAQGILEKINGILLGRQHFAISTEIGAEILESIRKIVVEEESLSQLPIIGNMDFGHVQPTLTLPYGALTEINCQTQIISILESGVL